MSLTSRKPPVTLPRLLRWLPYGTHRSRGLSPTSRRYRSGTVFKFFKNNKKSPRARHHHRRHRPRNLGFEQVEGRQMMAANILGGITSTIGPPLFELPPEPEAEGSITF